MNSDFIDIMHRTYITNNMDKFTKIMIPQDKLDRIHDFVPNLITAKMGEKHHRRNHISEEKRWTTGLMGETAVEELLGIDIIDWTIGDSKDYDRPDLVNYGIGIKTVEYGNFPLIPFHNIYPQIFCIKKENDIYVAGIASTMVLNTCQSVDLVRCIPFRRTRTGFYGFLNLHPLRDMSDLENFMCSQNIHNFVCEKSANF